MKSPLAGLRRRRGDAMCRSAARDPATIARRGGVAGAGEHAAASLTPPIC